MALSLVPLSITAYEDLRTRHISSLLYIPSLIITIFIKQDILFSILSILFSIFIIFKKDGIIFHIGEGDIETYLFLFLMNGAKMNFVIMISGFASVIWYFIKKEKMVPFVTMTFFGYIVYMVLTACTVI